MGVNSAHETQVIHALESSIHASFGFLGMAHHPMTFGLGLRYRPEVLRREARLPDQPPASGDTSHAFKQ